MEIDPHTVPGGTVLEAEVCVVGGGPAGLTLAIELGRAGRRVLVLESGLRTSDHGTQRLNHGTVVGTPSVDLRRTRHRQVGGTPHLWNTAVEGTNGWAKYVPLDPRDLASGNGGWPFEWDHLEPFYRRAQAFCGLGPFEWEAAAWRNGEGAPPALADDLRPRVYQFAPGSRWTRELPEQIGIMPNVMLLPGATATRLEMERRGTRVRAVRVASSAGQITARADQLVLAAGAVENARLLLVSGQGTAAPGNAHGQAGLGFMEHPRDYSPVLLAADRNLFDRLRFFDAHRARDGTIVCGHIAPAAGLLDTERLPSFSVTLRPRSLGRLTERVRLRLLGRSVPQPGHGWSQRDAAREAWEGFRLVVNLEQRPDPANRVRLGRERDRHGVPLPVLHWRWSAAEQAELERIRALLRDRFRAAGLGRLYWPAGAAPDPNAHHHAGTTRMHPDPRQGVVDTDGRVHGVDNLWVAGASAFPRAGFANPTLTIVAMAIRLADRLRIELRGTPPCAESRS